MSVRRAGGTESATGLDVRILVVDDDPVVFELVAEQLGERGFSALTAAGVEPALALFESERPALVLTDVRMAPLDGYALLQEVRRRAPEVPVVLMSSFSPPGMAASAIRAGAAGFLLKPFTEQQLLDAVDAALGTRGPGGASEDDGD